MAMHPDTFSAFADEIGKNDNEIADLLQLSRASVAKYRVFGAPKVVGLACSALALKLGEWGAPKAVEHQEASLSEDEPFSTDILDEGAWQNVLDALGVDTFNTQEFVNALQRTQPRLWDTIVQRYTLGGQGAGVHYSAFSFASQMLSRRVNAGLLTRGRFVKAPAGWGSAVIRTWSLAKA